MKAQLTEGTIGIELIRLSLPTVWGVFSILAFSLADTYFVAQLGTRELAAISFTFPVVTILGSVAMGLGTGTSSVIARTIGAGNRWQVQRLTTDSLLLSLLIVALLASLGLATIDPLFAALGAGPELLPLIRDYMDIWYLGMVFLVVPLVGNNAIRASGNTVVPSLIMTLAAAANILLDPLFIFGWGPFPALGIEGAAVATTLARAGTLVASLAFLHFRERLLLFSLPSLKGMATSCRRLLSVGLPAAATNLISPLSVGLVTSLLARYGAEAVAGFCLASRLEALALIAPLSLSASIAPFVGQNWGAQQYGRVKRALSLSFWFCLGWGALVAVLLGGAAPEIASWFDSDPAVVASAAAYLTIVPMSYGALGIVFASSSSFNALGKPLSALGMSLSRLLLLYIPLAYLGSQLFGLPGIFGASCLSNLAVGLGAWLWHSRWANTPLGNSKVKSHKSKVLLASGSAESSL
ncbi:MAG: MATE family efflux transporter [Xenococcaceae cyanobacterium]